MRTQVEMEQRQSTTASRPARVVILGVGNLLLKDEGIGVHIARMLEDTPSPPDTVLEVIDGGTLPDVLLTLDEVDKLIVVDAVQGRCEPGAVYRFHPDDIDVGGITLTSPHQISFLDSLWMMERFGQGPKDVVIIGVEPEETGWGLELSATLQERIPQIIRTVLREIGTECPGGPEKGERQDDSI